MVRSDEKRTPAEWSLIEGITVMDPDGWRFKFRTATGIYEAQDWEVPVDYFEWWDRMSISSIIRKAKRKGAGS